MKKKLLLLTLAAVLPLAACGKKDDEDKGGEPQLSPVQIKANELVESYSQFMEMVSGEELPAEAKPVFVAGAMPVAGHEIDVAKVYPHIQSIGTKGAQVNIPGIVEEIGQMKAEAVLDDTVYYFVGLGNGIVKLAAAYTAGQDPLVNETLAKIDANVDTIATNVSAIIDVALNVVPEVMTAIPTFMSVFDATTYKLNTEALKASFGAVKTIYTKLAVAKDNLKYLSDFVLPIVNVFEPIPEEVLSIAQLVKVSDIVGGAFDVLGFVVGSLETLDDEDYFAYIDGLVDPIEAISYAILGVVENIKNIAMRSVTDEAVEKAVEQVVAAGLSIFEMVAQEMKLEIPEEVQEILEGDKPKALLMAVANLLVDGLNLNLDSISAKGLAKIPTIVLTCKIAGTLDPLARPINEFLVEFTGEEAAVQADKIAKDIVDILTVAVNIFAEDVSPLLGDLIPNNILPLIARVDIYMPENSAIFKKIVLDIAVVVKDLFGAFVPGVETPAELSFTDFIFSIIEGPFDLDDFKVSEARIASVPTLLGDLYELFEGLNEGLSQTITDMVTGLLGQEEVTIASKEVFVGYYYNVVKGLLVVVTPEQPE